MFELLILPFFLFFKLPLKWRRAIHGSEMAITVAFKYHSLRLVTVDVETPLVLEIIYDRDILKLKSNYRLLTDPDPFSSLSLLSIVVMIGFLC